MHACGGNGPHHVPSPIEEWGMILERCEAPREDVRTLTDWSVDTHTPAKPGCSSMSPTLS